MSNFTSASNTINTAVGLSFQLGALGLTFKLVDNLTNPQRYQSKRKQPNYFDYGYRPKKSRRKNQDIFAFDF